MEFVRASVANARGHVTTFTPPRRSNEGGRREREAGGREAPAVLARSESKTFDEEVNALQMGGVRCKLGLASADSNYIN